MPGLLFRSSKCELKKQKKLLYLSPPPRKILETLRTGHFFIFPRPYMMSKIHKKENFVILSGMDLPWYTHCVFAWIYTFNFALIYIFLMKMT